MKKTRRRIDVNLEELDRVLDGAREAPLSDADHDKLKDTLHALAELLVRTRNTEKTSAVVGKQEDAQHGTQPDNNATPPPGHGRNGAEAFGGARKSAREIHHAAWMQKSSMQDGRENHQLHRWTTNALINPFAFHVQPNPYAGKMLRYAAPKWIRRLRYKLEDAWLGNRPFPNPVDIRDKLAQNHESCVCCFSGFELDLKIVLEILHLLGLTGKPAILRLEISQPRSKFSVTLPHPIAQFYR